MYNSILKVRNKSVILENEVSDFEIREATTFALYVHSFLYRFK